ncbi:MAG: hypothetical protein ACT4OS_07580 [Acidimicrobiales bacterium]
MDAIESLPVDVPGLHQGVLWLARQVEEFDRSLQEASGEVAGLNGRLAGVEVREQALVRAAQGIEGFRRELAWVTAEVRARGELVSAATQRLAVMAETIDELRDHADRRLGEVEGHLESVGPGIVKALVRGEAGRIATGVFERVNEVRGRLENLEAQSGLLVSENQLTAVLERLGDLEARQAHAGTFTETRLATVLERLADLEARQGEVEAEPRVAPVLAAVERLETAIPAMADRIAALGRDQEQRASTEAVNVLERLVESQALAIEAAEANMSAMAGRLEEVATGLIGPLQTRVDQLAADLIAPLDARVEQMAADLIAPLDARVEQMATDLIAPLDARVEHMATETIASLDARVERMATDLIAPLDSRVEQMATETIASLDARVEHMATETIASLDARVERMATDLIAPLDSRVEQMATEAIGALETRVDALAEGLREVPPGIEEAVSREAAVIGQAIDELRWRLEQVAGESQAGLDGVTGVAAERLSQALDRIEAVEATTATLADLDSQVSALNQRAREQAAALSALELRAEPLEGAVGDLSAQGAAITAMVAALGTRTDPLEASLDELSGDIVRITSEMAANQQSGLWAIQVRTDELAARLTAVETLPGDLGQTREALAALESDIGEARQAALAATTEQLASLARLRTLESMPGDLEDVYRELERVADLAGAAAGSALEAIAGRLEPVEATAEGLRADLDRLETELSQALAAVAVVESAQAQPATGAAVDELVARVLSLEESSGALAAAGRESEERLTGSLVTVVANAVEPIESRLASLEALSGDVESLYRELDQVVEVATTRQGELWAMADPVRGLLDSLPARLETVAARVEELAGRLAPLEELPAGMQAATEMVPGLEARLAEVTAATDGLPEVVDALRGQVQAVAGEIHMAATNAERAVDDGEQIGEELRSVKADLVRMEGEVGGIHTEMTAVSSGLSEVRNDVVQVQTDVAQVQTEVAQVQTEVAQVEALSVLVPRVEALEAGRLDISAELSALERSVDDLAEMASTRPPDIGGLSAQLADSLVGPSSQVNVLSAQLQALDAKVAQTDVVTDANTQKLDALMLRLDGAAAELATQVEARTQLLARLEAAEGELDALVHASSEIEAWRRHAGDDRAGWADEGRALAARLEALERLPADIQTLRERFGGLGATADAVGAELQGEVDSLAQGLGSMSSGLDGFRQEVARLAAELESARAELWAGQGELVDSIAAVERSVAHTAASVEALGVTSGPGPAGSGSDAQDPFALVEQVRGELDQVRHSTQRSLSQMIDRLEMVEEAADRVGGLQRRLEAVAEVAEANLAATAAAGAPTTAATAAAEAEISRLAAKVEDLVDDVAHTRVDLVTLAGRISGWEDLEGDVAALEGRLGEMGAVYQVAERDIADLRAQVEAVAASTGDPAVIEAIRVRLEHLSGQEAMTETARGDLERLSVRMEALEQRRFDAGPGESLARRIDVLEAKAVDPTLVVELRRRLDLLASRSAAAEALLVLERRMDALAAAAGDPGAIDELRGRIDALSEQEAAYRERADRQAAQRQTAEDEMTDRASADREKAQRQTADRERSERERADHLEAVTADLSRVERALSELSSRVDASDVAGLRESVDQLDARLSPAMEILRRQMQAWAADFAGTDQVLALERRVAALMDEAVDPAQVSALATRMDDLATRSGEGPAADRDLGSRIDEVAGRVGALETLPRLVAGMGRMLQKAVAAGSLDGSAIEALEERLKASITSVASAADALGESVGTIEGRVGRLDDRLDDLDTRLAPVEALPLAPLPAEVARLAEHIRSLSEALADVRTGGQMELASRTAPIMESLGDLQGAYGQLAEEAVALAEAMRTSAGGIDQLDERIRRMEGLAEDINRQEAVLARLDSDVIAGQLEAVANTTNRLADLDAKVSTLEALKEEVDGLYGSLYRLAEQAGYSVDG